jgi:PAS domain S-box-containing protein
MQLDIEPTIRELTAEFQLGQSVGRLDVAENSASPGTAALAALLDLIPVPIILISDRECQKVRPNVAVSEVYGTPMGVTFTLGDLQQVPQPWKAFRDGRELAEEEWPLRRAASHGIVVRNEPCDVLFQDGHIIHLLISATPMRDPAGQPAGCIGVLVDVTTQTAIYRERQRVLDILDALISAAPVGIALFDDQMHYQLVNGPLAEMNGVPASEHLGKTQADIIPDVYPFTKPIFEKVLASGLPILDREVYAATPKAPAEKRWWLNSWFPVPGRDGQPALVGEIVLDITRRKRAEESLAEANRRKDEFLAMLGHELRNPLSAILSSSQALELMETSVPDARQLQEIIARQAQDMSRMVDDLLDVSRIARGKIVLRKESIDLTQIVHQATEDQRSHLEANHCLLETEIPGQSVWFQGDPTRIGQVLSNLLVNACKFSEPGGIVRVRMEVEPGQSAALISVTDTGIGMTPEVLRSIFTPLTQADSSLDRSRGGLGLGLALVKGLVEAHGGSVTARSAGPGSGSEFVIRLPLEQGTPSIRERHESVARKPREPAPMPVSRKAFRILLIDDRRDSLLPMQKMLTLAGHDVTTAPDAPTGLAAARQFHPEIVLCDIGLPGGMTGYEFAKVVRADPALQGIYLVAVTGYGQEEDRRRAQEVGFDYHVTKPISKQILDMLTRDLPRFPKAS